jgi:hypothetical protein
MRARRATLRCARRCPARPMRPTVLIERIGQREVDDRGLSAGARWASRPAWRPHTPARWSAISMFEMPSPRRTAPGSSGSRCTPCGTGRRRASVSGETWLLARPDRHHAICSAARNASAASCCGSSGGSGSTPIWRCQARRARRTPSHAMGARESRSPLRPRGEAAAMAGLPIAALRLEPSALVAAARFGLERIGDLYTMPRGPLARRLGLPP